MFGVKTPVVIKSFETSMFDRRIKSPFFSCLNPIAYVWNHLSIFSSLHRNFFGSKIHFLMFMETMIILVVESIFQYLNSIFLVMNSFFEIRMYVQ